MKTIRELKPKDWSGYIFKEMVYILDMEPGYFMVNGLKDCKDGSIVFSLCHCSEDSVPHIAFNDIECIFRKRRIYSYLIFCETDKNKNMINNYVKISDKLKEELLSWIDELEDDSFKSGNAFIRFKFRTDDNLVYNKKINIPVCAISLSSVVKKRCVYYPNFRLQKCFYEYKSFLKNK